jgi:hypothetical protein
MTDKRFCTKTFILRGGLSKKSMDYFVPRLQSHSPLSLVIIMLGTN